MFTNFLDVVGLGTGKRFVGDLTDLGQEIFLPDLSYNYRYMDSQGLLQRPGIIVSFKTFCPNTVGCTVASMLYPWTERMTWTSTAVGNGSCSSL